jgi:hypothetical protein
MTFDEDRDRKDHGPENLATVRKLALNFLQTARPGISIHRKRKRSGWSNDSQDPSWSKCDSPAVRGAGPCLQDLVCSAEVAHTIL